MNVALRLLRSGVDVRLLSRVGRDALGRDLLDYLSSQGLSTDLIQIDELHPTGRVLVDMSDPREVRYDIAAPAAWDFIEADGNAEEPDGGGPVVVYGSLAARSEVSRGSLLRILAGAGLKVFDVNLRPPWVDRAVIEVLLRAAAWVKLNEEELAFISAWHGVAGPPDHALRELASRYGLEIVCLTLGGRGAEMLHRDRLLRHPGFEVEVVDTIGCGDSFLASWLSQMLGGADPRDALAQACAVGALVASREGANPAIDAAEIRAMTGS